MPPLTIYCDYRFPEPAAAALRAGTAAHRVVYAAAAHGSNLAPVAAEPALAAADIALGQPAVDGVLAAPRLRWVHLTSAGYARYDAPATRAALARAGVALTTSSAVYADPCAEHLLAMMLAFARGLPEAWADQHARPGAWPSAARRARSFLLRRQRVVVLGYGAIARRLCALLAPFEARVGVVRRAARGDEDVEVITEAALPSALAAADHLVDTLPEAPGTRGFVDATMLATLRPGAFVYNVGRGTTLDQDALLSALTAGHLGGAYLDVTDPEPLPAAHPLWRAPRCHITPHSAGGRREEPLALVEHFLANLARFERGEALLDRVV